MEHNRLTCQLGVIILRESDIDILLITSIHANDLLFKTGHKGTGTQLQVEIVALTTIESNTIVKTFEVNIGSVTHLSSTLDSLGRCNILSHAIQLCSNLLIGNGSLSLLYFQTLVVAQSDLGVDVSSDGDSDGAVIIDLHISQAGTANCLKILLNNSFLINLREDFLNSILIKNMGAVHSLDHLTRSLASAETRQHDSLTVLLVCLFRSLVHKFLADVHNDRGLIAILFNTLYVHLQYPPNYLPAFGALCYLQPIYSIK